MKIEVDVATPSAKKKKNDERASLEEERKGERTHRLPQVVEPPRA
jgi:hypothetical protein